MSEGQYRRKLAAAISDGQTVLRQLRAIAASVESLDFEFTEDPLEIDGHLRELSGIADALSSITSIVKLNIGEESRGECDDDDWDI